MKREKRYNKPNFLADKKKESNEYLCSPNAFNTVHLTWKGFFNQLYFFELKLKNYLKDQPYR